MMSPIGAPVPELPVADVERQFTVADLDGNVFYFHHG